MQLRLYHRYHIYCRMKTWRWIFSSSRLVKILPRSFPPILEHSLASLLSLVFPDECRLCNSPLRELTRVPVCPACLAGPQPFAADYFCSTCGTPFANAFPLDEKGQCGLCRRGLTAFDAAYAYGCYDGALREMVQLFKYGKVRTLATPLGALAAAALPRQQRFDVVTPMPMHWRRKWERGFNQAELLAREIARRTGLRMAPLVRRAKAAPPQAGLSRAARRTNVAGVFEVRRQAQVTGLRILLVDDVLTTGATASACAEVLKRAGAKYVTVLALARADRRPSGGFDAGVPALTTSDYGSMIDA